MLLNHQMSGTNSARKLALGSEIERQKTEPPLGLNIHGLYHSSTVWTRPWCWLPSQNPLILIAHKHQTHLSFCLLISFGQENSEKDSKFSVKTRLIAVWSIEFFYVVGLQIYLQFGVFGSLEQFSWFWDSDCPSGFLGVQKTRSIQLDFCV